MIRSRTRRFTRQPSAEHMRRICRLSPCVSTIRNWFGPARVTLQGFVFYAADAHARGHHREEVGGDFGLDRHEVFLLVPVLFAQHLVDDVAIVREQDEPLGILVEPADREDAFGVADEVHDVAGRRRAPSCR